MVKLLAENIGGKLLDIGLVLAMMCFFKLTPKHQPKSKSKQVGLCQAKLLKKQPMKWENIFTNHLSEVFELISKIYK